MENIERKAIAKCQKGDLGSFAILYDLYFERIYSFIFFKTLHKETAEDTTSKTFLKALDKIRNFDESKGSFSSWLFVIAKRSVIDHYRTQKYTYNIADRWDIASKDDVFEHIANKEALEKASKYLKCLKPQKRDLVIMRVWQDLSYKEISQVTGKTQASLKMMFSRLIDKVRSSTLVALLIASQIFIQNP